MKKEEYQKIQNFFYPTLIVLLAALIRIFPHPPNFTPISAMALFGGSYLDKKVALVIPLAAMFLSDLFLGFHSTMGFVYLSFILIGGIGIWLKSHKSLKTVIAASLISSILFFIITNFGVWFLYNFYPKNISGLTACYIAGIPFFRNTLFGDLFYVSLLFGSFELLKKIVFQHKALPQK